MQDFVSQIRNLAFGENTLALRLVNASLREALPDLRVGYANRILPPAAAEPYPMGE